MAGGRQVRILILVMAAPAMASAFVKDGAPTAGLLPAVMQGAHQTKIIPSKLLISIALASPLGAFRGFGISVHWCWSNRPQNGLVEVVRQASLSEAVD